jgi:hypothetical protein
VNGAYLPKRTTSSLMVASKAKVNFCPDVSTSPGNYGYIFVCLVLQTLNVGICSTMNYVKLDIFFT